MPFEDEDLFIGVDVGTSSVRCAVVSGRGRVLSSAVQPILTASPRPEYFQQSSDNIWQATCDAVKTAMAGQQKHDVRGIGFDATCSLVVLDQDFRSLSVSPDGEPEQNIVLWMDHRAKAEADEINAKQFGLLKYVGGKISVEMQPPKLMWLKRHLPKQWKQVGHVFDLPDFLTWKATGSLTRSLCSLVCKMMYQANENGNNWDENFWKSIGLEELVQNNFHIIGNEVLAPGIPCGGGLNELAAAELSLPFGTPVGTSMIDAHAGGIGCLGCRAEGVTSAPSSRLVLICGTSTCHMAVSDKSMFVSGVWGPYYSAMVPGLWLNEAGQSAAGSLIDHIIKTHPASKEFSDKHVLKNKHFHTSLNDYLFSLAQKRGLTSVSRLTSDLHVWPDFHGNRSPVADPSLKGMVLGLTLTADQDSLAVLYLATLQALAYSSLQILRCLQASGHRIESIIMCGGLSKNTLYTQMHADVTGLPVLLPDEEESVLLGAAVLGAAAASGGDVQSAMNSLGGRATVRLPSQEDRRYHEKKYKVFLSMLDFQKETREDMKDFQ